MSPKPFGKAHRSFWNLPILTRGVIITLALGPIAFVAFLSPAKSHPTLSEGPLVIPSLVGFTLLTSVALTLWWRRKPSPRGPGESSRMKITLLRFFLSLFVAVPVGFIASVCYTPAFTALNGWFSGGAERTIHAFVRKQDGMTVLTSPYWGSSFQAKIHRLEDLPKESTGTTVAKLTLRRGVMGALWIEKIEYEYLP